MRPSDRPQPPFLKKAADAMDHRAEGWRWEPGAQSELRLRRAESLEQREREQRRELVAELRLRSVWQSLVEWVYRSRERIADAGKSERIRCDN